MSQANELVNTELREKIGNLNKKKDKYVIFLAKMSDNGQVINYNCEVNDFPMNDMALAANSSQKMIRQHHEASKRKQSMTSQEKAELDAANDLKNMLE
jgi:hypothetical protein